MTQLSEDAKIKIRHELLKLGENVGKDSVDTVFNIIELVVKDTENKIDDSLLVILPKLKDIVLKYVDKISE